MTRRAQRTEADLEHLHRWRVRFVADNEPDRVIYCAWSDTFPIPHAEDVVRLTGDILFDVVDWVVCSRMWDPESKTIDVRVARVF